ncbi:MAG: hypothetical protein LBK82_12090, partial [Planctomycetaceae bacterium]|nr:hypothetical protein [Planctomycetaceae bacterium]
FTNENETDIFYPLSLDKPKGSTGTRAFAIFRGRWEIIAFGEVGESGAKELFPAIVYRKSDTETYIICPGGRNEDQSIKAVHVLHVESRTVSSSKFGALPMAMSNFGAVIADNGYGSPVLVCAPGEVESGTKYPVQRYDFVTEEWVKSDTTQSLAGCPAYVKDGKMIFPPRLRVPPSSWSFELFAALPLAPLAPALVPVPPAAPPFPPNTMSEPKLSVPEVKVKTAFPPLPPALPIHHRRRHDHCGQDILSTQFQLLLRPEREFQVRHYRLVRRYRRFHQHRQVRDIFILRSKNFEMLFSCFIFLVGFDMPTVIFINNNLT